MRSGVLIWVKHRLASELIGLQALFNDYWSSTKREFTVPSKSSLPTSPPETDDEAQRTLLSLESIVSITGL